MQLWNSEAPNEMRGGEDQRCLAERAATPPAGRGMCPDCQTFPKLNISASDKLTIHNNTITPLHYNPVHQHKKYKLRIFPEISWARLLLL